jgi:hypothetical protein
VGGDATRRIADSFPWVIDLGQASRDVIGGVPDSARTVAGFVDGSTDSIEEDIDAVQKVVDPWQESTVSKFSFT